MGLGFYEVKIKYLAKDPSFSVPDLPIAKRQAEPCNPRKDLQHKFRFRIRVMLVDRKIILQKILMDDLNSGGIQSIPNNYIIPRSFLLVNF